MATTVLHFILFIIVPTYSALPTPDYPPWVDFYAVGFLEE